MTKKTLIEKLALLADAAKYDASCASSGTTKRSALGTNGVGSSEGMGICHAYAPDGRCISLLKVLLTNFCIFDCQYCVNRASSNVERARFTPEELIKLTLDFYKRNYIEGLFLSSGIIQSSDYTMEQLIHVARSLRNDHGFRGYIHLKTIPDADPLLIEEAGRVADRLSINIELPQAKSLKTLAPEKSEASIKTAMAGVRQKIEEVEGEKRARIIRKARAPKFAPAGQSTQMIIGADLSDDRCVLATSSKLYAGYRLRRVYYSAFSPIPDASGILPGRAPPLQREHRLYQADWMLRFYGFEADEIIGNSDGMLDLEIDPKLAWALRHRQLFPVDINRADREMLLRVPGLGHKSVAKIIRARYVSRLRIDDLVKLCRSIKTCLPFITTIDWSPGATIDALNLRERFLPQPRQMDLFA